VGEGEISANVNMKKKRKKEENYVGKGIKDDTLYIKEN
jgi:hypothetical protein